MKTSRQLALIPPGEILLEDFMQPFALSINRLARDLDVPPNRISGIVNGTRSITADTALRLGTYFDVSAETWLGLQLDHELRLVRQQKGAEIVRRSAPGRPPRHLSAGEGIEYTLEYGTGILEVRFWLLVRPIDPNLSVPELSGL